MSLSAIGEFQNRTKEKLAKFTFRCFFKKKIVNKNYFIRAKSLKLGIELPQNLFSKSISQWSNPRFKSQIWALSVVTMDDKTYSNFKSKFRVASIDFPQFLLPILCIGAGILTIPTYHIPIWGVKKG